MPRGLWFSPKTRPRPLRRGVSLERTVAVELPAVHLHDHHAVAGGGKQRSQADPAGCAANDDDLLVDQLCVAITTPLLLRNCRGRSTLANGPV